MSDLRQHTLADLMINLGMMPGISITGHLTPGPCVCANIQRMFDAASSGMDSCSKSAGNEGI